MNKRLTKAVKQFDRQKNYSTSEAIDLIKKTSSAKFDESVEVHLKLGIDTKKGEQQVRGMVSLPHGTGKTKRIAAFVEENRVEEAKKAGADIAGGDDLINEIKKTEKCDFDIAIATPGMMKKLGPVAKVMGPKGLMPSPKEGTITNDIAKTIEEMKKGKVNFRNDDTGNLHQLVGKVSFDKQKLLENLNTLLDAVRRAKPASSKGVYIQTAVVCSTMGPAIKIQV